MLAWEVHRNRRKPLEPAPVAIAPAGDRRRRAVRIVTSTRSLAALLRAIGEGYTLRRAQVKAGTARGDHVRLALGARPGDSHTNNVCPCGIQSAHHPRNRGVAITEHCACNRFSR